MHVIRLRDPWEIDRQAATICYRRRFGEPTNLDVGQRVWLVLDGADSAVTATLNGQALTAHSGPGIRFELTGRLSLRNELLLTLPVGAAGLGEVRLEIEEPERRI